MKPYTPGPWHWVDGTDDMPLEIEQGLDGDWRIDLRTVAHDKPGVLEDRPLPRWLLSTYEETGEDNEVANMRLLALAPDLADYVYERAAAGDPLAEKLVAKLEARDTAPTP